MLVRLCSKSFKLGFSNTWTGELPDVQAGFRKGRGTRGQVANICWIIEKAKEFEKTSTSASLTMLKPLTVWITTNCRKFLKRWDRLPCLSPEKLVSGSAGVGQEAISRTGHGTIDLFQIEKGVWQGCILSPCLFSICRVHYVKCQLGWITSWNQDCWEKYQQPQICRWYHSNGRKWTKTKKPLFEGERVEWKSNLKTQFSKK